MSALNFDLPYGPFAAAFKSLGRAFVGAAVLTIAITTVFLFANRLGPFERPLSSPAAEVGPHVVGGVGGGISLTFAGLQVTVPGEKGVCFEAQSSLRKDGQAIISVKRWKVDAQGVRSFDGVTHFSNGGVESFD